MEAGERAGWIAVLEAHYGRFLGLHVRQTAQELQKAADSVRDGKHLLLGHGLRPEEVLQKMIKVSVEVLLKDADEARQAVMMAKQVRDDELANFVRWNTLPAWREQMIGLGYQWDDEAMRWLVPGDDL